MNIKTLFFACALAGLGLAVQAAPSASERLKAACLSADFDHDNHVSLDEFHRDVVNGWHALPSDAQGFVQIAQLVAIPGMARDLLERLKAADADTDGRLSFQEVVKARMAYFEAGDTNRDDRLSIQECVDHQRKMLAATGKARK